MKISNFSQKIGSVAVAAGTKQKAPVIFVILPFLSMLAAVLPSVVDQTTGINTVKIGIITLLLTGAVSFYIRANADSILQHKMAKTIITLSYLGSICLLLFVPEPGIFCFWMLGGLLVSMLVDYKVGLLLHFNLSFLLGISGGNSQDQIVQVLIIGILMSMLSGAIKNKGTMIYAAIIILSVNTTISFVINNLIFSKTANYDYLQALISLLAVILMAFVIHALVTGKSFISEFSLEEFVEANQGTSDLLKKDTLLEQDLTHKDVGLSEKLEVNVDTNCNVETDSVVPSMANPSSASDPLAVSNQFAATETNTVDEIVKVDEQDPVDNKVSENKLVTTLETATSMETVTAKEEVATNESMLSNKDQLSVYGTTVSNQSLSAFASYDILCDLNNELMSRIKEYSDSLYQHSQYIGELSQRAAKAVGADDMLALAGGYYHEVGKLMGKNYIEEGLSIAKEYHFPNELCAIIKEHNIKFGKPNSIEAVIVMLSDSVVSTIDYIEKNDDHKYTTNKIIDNIFQLRMEKGTFDASKLSLKDFKLLKEFYQKEFEK